MVSPRTQARILARALGERASRAQRPRQPEAMVMDGAESVAAFHSVDSIYQLRVYRYNAEAISRLLPEDGVVLDLGSGSGQLLAHLAQARPDVRAVGVDLAETMLDRGRALLREQQLEGRIELRRADMTDFAEVVPPQVDLVSSVWALHHLPGRDALDRCLRGIARVRAAAGCAVWIFDFARLKHQATMSAVLDLNPHAPAVPRSDRAASERAAWTAGELREALDAAGLGVVRGGRERVVGHFQAYGAPGRAGCPTGHHRWAGAPLPSSSAFVLRQLRLGMPRIP